MRSVGEGAQTRELGAEFIGPGHVRVRRLVSGAGSRLVDSALYRGPFYWRLEDGRKPRRGYLPPLSRSDWVALLRIGLAAARQARRLDPIAPWLSPEAAALDQLTAAEWLTCNS